MVGKLNSIIQRFMSIALILSGTLLLINYLKKTSPDWGDAILWIAITNLVIGLAVYILGLKQRRDALEALQSDESDEGQA